MLSLDLEFLPMGKLAPPPSSACGHHTGQVPLVLRSGCNTDSMPLKSWLHTMLNLRVIPCLL